MGFEESAQSSGALEDLNADFGHIDILQEDALEYIAGYIIRKQNLAEYECDQNSYTRVDQVSKGFLKKPSSEFVSHLKQLETVFKSKIKSEILHKPKIRQKIIESSCHVNLPLDVKILFFKCRIFFRINNQKNG